MGLILTDHFPVGFTSVPLNNNFDRLGPYSHHIEDTHVIVDEKFGKAMLTNEFDSVVMKKSVAINRLSWIHHRANDVSIRQTESFSCKIKLVRQLNCTVKYIC